MRGLTDPARGDGLTIYGDKITLPDESVVEWNRHQGGLHLELRKAGRTARRDIPATVMDGSVEQAQRAVQEAVDAMAADLQQPAT